MKGKKITDILLVIIFIIGFSLLMYPILTSFISRNEQNKIIEKYINYISTMNEEESSLLISEARNYNLLLQAKGYKDLTISGKTYEQVLKNSSSDIMGYIEIDKLGVKLPIYHGTSENVLQMGVGHWERSSFPVGGVGTHTVLMGHRGLPTSKLFTNLDKMKVGDNFNIYILKEELQYVVDQVKIVLPSELNDLKIVPDKDYITLVTCTPYGINSHRLLVRGVRVTEKNNIVNELVINSEVIDVSKYFIIFMVIVSISLLIVLFFLSRSKKEVIEIV